MKNSGVALRLVESPDQVDDVQVVSTKPQRLKGNLLKAHASLRELIIDTLFFEGDDCVNNGDSVDVILEHPESELAEIIESFARDIARALNFRARGKDKVPHWGYECDVIDETLIRVRFVMDQKAPEKLEREAPVEELDIAEDPGVVISRYERLERVEEVGIISRRILALEDEIMEILAAAIPEQDFDAMPDVYAMSNYLWAKDKGFSSSSGFVVDSDLSGSIQRAKRRCLI